MEHLILPPEDGKIIDHIDGNGLNNRRHNLRQATHHQNMMNLRKRKATSSKFKGVSLCKQTSKWRAQIGFKTNGRTKQYMLGRFKSEVEAAKTYDRFAISLFGKFAQVNFPK